MIDFKTATIEQWFDYIQTLHSSEIELGIERVNEVYRRLYPAGMACKIISVAGTNGKGSTSELLSSIYHQAGYRVGKFTSPHLIDFGERYVINGCNAGEQAMLAAFNKIESVRGNTPITFFEYGALLAVELFSAAKVDVAIMEVGLGGRLDAVNMLDADLSIVTSISVDHTAWLGSSIEGIAREKVGIARANKPCVVGIEKTPQSIVDYCVEIGAQLHTIGQQFGFTYDSQKAEQWDCWFDDQTSLAALPLPYQQDGVQLSNASVALQAVKLLLNSLPVTNESIYDGVRKAVILARCQVLSVEPLIVLDVAHNESSVTRLKSFVLNKLKAAEPCINVTAVCGMLKDKEIASSLAILAPIVDQWHFAGIDNERGASAAYLKQELALSAEMPVGVPSEGITCHDKIITAYNHALKTIKPNDVIIVFGSFFVAGDILRSLK